MDVGHPEIGTFPKEVLPQSLFWGEIPVLCTAFVLFVFPSLPADDEGELLGSCRDFFHRFNVFASRKGSAADTRRQF